MKLIELLDYTGQLLEIARFQDYCPNGLQVEGKAEVNTLVSGVSASMLLLEAAADLGADAVLVHHGWFWKNEDACVTGVKQRRMAFLLQRDISLIGYHLPLDAHPELGNNAQFGRRLGMEIEGWFGEQRLGAYGTLPYPVALHTFCGSVEMALDRTPCTIGDQHKVIRRVAWCTGAAQDYLGQAVMLGVDAFITGEISEHTVHLSRESGVAVIAAGHHATERYGVHALGEYLARRFGLAHQFVDVNNPV
jgi:dinuclear metal center YbgI/SA1388 family protein